MDREDSQSRESADALSPAPNFFVVGAGKTGTTSLHAYLNQHPQIYMSPVKEPCYFASEIRGNNIAADLRARLAAQTRMLRKILNDGREVKPLGWIAQDWDDYLRLFRNVRSERAIGESSAAYLWSPTAAANIRARIPEARIVMILRDPAERAFSQYLHQQSAGLTRAGFRDHIQRCLEDEHKQLSIYYPFLEAGMYSAQVERFLAQFPSSQIKVYWYEEAWRDPQSFLRDLFEFLEVDPSFTPDTTQKSLQRRRPRFENAHYYLKKFKVWHVLRSAVPAQMRRMAFRTGDSLNMDPADRRFLIDYYRPDIRRLSKLLNRDLNSWLM